MIDEVYHGETDGLSSEAPQNEKPRATRDAGVEK